jgi:L-iditol 2-dehydrogenase
MSKPTQVESAWIIEPGHIMLIKDELPGLQPNEVLVKVENMGICGTDLEIYQGDMFYFTEGMATYPIIPGHEWSGQIVDIGIDVNLFEIGDRVVGETTLPCNSCDACRKGRYNICPGRKENGILGKNGSAAQYMVYPSNGLHKFDLSIDFESACLTEPAAVAYSGIAKVNVSPNDQVIIFGAGTLGLLSLQAAKLFSTKQIVLVDINEFRLKMGKNLGADHVIDISKESLIDKSNELTKGKGFDVVIEASGNLVAIENMLNVAGAGSRICLMGLCGGHSAKMNTDRIVTSDIHLCGSLGSPGVWTKVLDLMKCGKILTKPLITHRFSLKELDKAFRLLQAKEPKLLKTIIQID